MKNYVYRAAAIAAAVMAMFVLMMAFQQETVHAAFYDRTAEGAVVMPEDKTLALPEGQEVKVNFGTTYDYESYYYFQIKPSKTGTISFTNDYSSGYTVALCNAKKKVVSIGDTGFDDFYSYSSSYPYQMVLHYGVKGGTTYYIRVKGASTFNEYNGPYVGSLKWTNARVKTTKYGKKKSKAVSIKKKKTAKGLFKDGNTKGQWFKITTSQKKTIITVNSPKTNGYMVFKFWYKSYGKWYTTTRTASRSNGKYVLEGSTSRKAKHTYFIKVYPEHKASGCYSIKWK